MGRDSISRATLVSRYFKYGRRFRFLVVAVGGELCKTPMTLELAKGARCARLYFATRNRGSHDFSSARPCTTQVYVASGLRGGPE